MQIMKFIKSLAYPSEMLPPIVEEESHFDPETEHSAAKLGMWLFLATELLLFGGLFAAYAIFRAKYPVMFAEGSANLDVVLGSVNTVIFLVLINILNIHINLAMELAQAQIFFILFTLLPQVFICYMFLLEWLFLELFLKEHMKEDILRRNLLQLKSVGCIGTLSILFGFICFHCCI